MVETLPDTRTRQIGMAVIVAVAVAAIGFVLVSGGDRAVLDDGTHTVQVVVRDPADHVVTLDEVTLLTGEEAREAAIADGVLDPNEDLDNDYYLSDSEESLVDVRVATDAELMLVECNGGCKQAPAELNAFLAGEVQPFNGETALFEVIVDRGRIVAIREVYLP